MFKGSLVREVRDWVEDGVIAPAQGEAILARYGRSLADADRAGMGYRILMALAVLFAGAAVLLLLSHNWDELSRAGRMTGLITITAVLNGMGFREWVRGHRDQATLWWFAGGLMYGASLMLIAQIYHLGEHFPDGLLFWALGVLPLALLTASRLLHALQLTLATFWMMTQWYYGMPWLLPLFAGAALYQVIYREPSSVLRNGALALLLIWANGLLSWWLGAFHDWHWRIWTAHLVLTGWLVFLIQGVGLTQLTHPLRGRRDQARWASNWRLWLGIPLLLVFSYQQAWNGFMDDWLDMASPLWALPWVLVAVLAWFIRWPERGRYLAGVAAFSLVLLLAARWPTEAMAFWLATGINLLLLVIGIVLLRVGWQSHHAGRFYGGLGLLLLLVMMRYVSLIGDYISGAMLFAVAGVILFGAASYWRRRDAQGGASDDV